MSENTAKTLYFKNSFYCKELGDRYFKKGSYAPINEDEFLKLAPYAGIEIVKDIQKPEKKTSIKIK